MKKSLALRFTDKLADIINNRDNLILFCFVYLIFNINCRGIGTGDTVPASLLPFNILEYHNLNFDQFYSYYAYDWEQVWFFKEINGHYLSIYPIVIPVLTTSLYIIPYIYLKSNNIPFDMFNPAFAMTVPLMEKLSASLIASISVVFVYLSLKELADKKTAAIVALIYAFATNTWTISSQALWQQGLVELLLAMSIFLVLRNERASSNKSFIFLGILSGLFIFNRPMDGILIIPVVYYVLALERGRFNYYAISAFLSSAPFLLYNLYFFGSLFGGYSDPVFLKDFDIGPDMIYRLLGLLISPSRGLFIYTPVMLLSIFGYLKVTQISNRRIRIFLLILGLSCSILLFAYCAWIQWWGGGCYGPRLLTGMLPGLAIFLGLFIKSINLDFKNKKNIFLISILSLLLVWSIFVQFVGAFYYPNGNWDEGSNETEKLWDWRDTQIKSAFNAGMVSTGNCFENIRSYVALVHQESKSAYRIFPANGWHGQEQWEGVPSRWMEANATLIVYSPSNRTANLSLRTTSFHHQRTLEIYTNDEFAGRVEVPTSFINVNVPVRVANGTNTVRLHVLEGCERPSDIKEMKNPDSRCLSIGVQSIAIA